MDYGFVFSVCVYFPFNYILITRIRASLFRSLTILITILYLVFFFRRIVARSLPFNNFTCVRFSILSLFMSSHYCVFRRRLFTHCRDLIFLSVVPLWFGFFFFQSHSFASFSSPAFTLHLDDLDDSCACQRHSPFTTIQNNIEVRNGVYSRLIILTIILCVSDIFFIVTLPNDYEEYLVLATRKFTFLYSFLLRIIHLLNAYCKLLTLNRVNALLLMMLCIFSLECRASTKKMWFFSPSLSFICCWLMSFPYTLCVKPWFARGILHLVCHTQSTLCLLTQSAHKNINVNTVPRVNNRIIQIVDETGI